MTKKISFVTLGCKLNYAETSTFERKFIAHGFEVVPWNEKADICLVNTCSVTEHSDKKCRNIIRKLHRSNPLAAIVVTGCYAELKRKEIEAIEGVKFVFGAKEKSRVVPTVVEYALEKEELAAAEQGGGQNARPDGGAGCGEDIFAAFSTGERTRSFLKIQDGCDYKCAYCTVPYARGESRNIPMSEVLSQAREIAAAGVKEIVLTGVNTGDFGKTTGESFLELLKALDAVEGIERYRISSIEPNLLTDEIIDWIASGTKFLPHFHIPLQSGCDKVLSQMGRRYDTAFFERKISRIRQRMEAEGRPKVFIGIDVIAGFPGESEEDFLQTYNFLKDRVRPAFIHIFPYSRRAGTRAAERTDQVQDCVKTKRVEMLEGLCAGLHSEFVQANRGIRERVLFESTDKDGMMYGYTGNYIRIARPYDPERIGQIVEVEI
ncbi:MAG: tRNA (N(6)-L-threonylcarbamoyladenosine(37)-C(2))-methylthiotransferase MtaB [Candidatus Cryptobacteroides sp.]